MKRPKAPPREPQLVSESELWRSQIRGGIGSRRDLHAQLKEELGIPYAFLTQSQYDAIETKAGLLYSSQFELNVALRRYWTCLREETVSQEIRDLANLAEEKIEDALEAISKVLNKGEEFFKGPIEFFQHSPLEQTDVLEQTMQKLLSAQKVVWDAQKRLARGRGQPSYGPLYDLIHQLDFILYKSTGKVLTRSKNQIHAGATDTPFEFVWSVVQIANLKVAKATVDTVLRDYIRDRKHDRMFWDRTL